MAENYRRFTQLTEREQNHLLAQLAKVDPEEVKKFIATKKFKLKNGKTWMAK